MAPKLSDIFTGIDEKDDPEFALQGAVMSLIMGGYEVVQG